VIERGEIWWASLPDTVGSGPGFRRPALVIQSDPFNQSRIQTVIVAAITSQVELGQAPGNVTLTARVSGLNRDSVVNVSQLLTIDRTLLTEYVSSIPARKMEQVDQGLRLALGL